MEELCPLYFHFTQTTYGTHTYTPDIYAYVEFAEPEHIDAALTMDNSLFRGRLIKVSRVESHRIHGHYLTGENAGDGQKNEHSRVQSGQRPWWRLPRGI